MARSAHRRLRRLRHEPDRPSDAQALFADFPAMICRIPSTLPIFACIAASVAMVAPAAPPSGGAVEFVAVFDAKRSWQVSPVHLIALSEAALIRRDAAPPKLAERTARSIPE